MIQKNEILQAASLYKVNPIIIEKDYVLGWILAGIGNLSFFSDSWVFKGGTCLKKCYFKEYRFSEDLDFTLTPEAVVDPSVIQTNLAKLATWLYEESGIEVPEILLEVFPDSNGKTFRGKIAYVGPLGQRGSFTRIKLDVTQNEFIAKAPINAEIFHPYSDKEGSFWQVNAYSYEEIFAEKIRALLERARPRDLYDVIYLFERKNDYDLNKTILREILLAKLAFRGTRALTTDTHLSEIQEKELIQDWESMLDHQIGDLEPVNIYLHKLPAILRWIEEG